MIDQGVCGLTGLAGTCEQSWVMAWSITTAVAMFVYGVISGSKKMMRKESVSNDVMIACIGFGVGMFLSFLVPLAFIALAFILPPFICMKILAALANKRKINNE